MAAVVRQLRGASDTRLRLMNIPSVFARVGARLRPYRWLILASLAAIAFVLGLDLGHEHLELDARMFRSTQLFFMGGELPEGAGAGFRFARFLAPIVAAWAAVVAFATLFRDQLDAMRVRYLRDHVIVCGVGDKGVRLARSLLATHPVAVVERSATSPHLRALREA